MGKKIISSIINLLKGHSNKPTKNSKQAVGEEDKADNGNLLENKGEDTIPETEMPKHLRPKVYGQNCTMVDILIAINEKEHFTSPDSALEALLKHLNRLKNDDDIVFNCSWRSINSFAHNCFEDGKLNIDKLQEACTHHYDDTISNIYAHYIAEKTAVLVSYMNEFRRYTNSYDLLHDFERVMNDDHETKIVPIDSVFPDKSGGYFIKPQNNATCFIEGKYFTPNGYVIKLDFGSYLSGAWDEITTDGVLDNAKFRDFMIERHERDVKKYGLETVIKNNYIADDPNNPEVFFPYRGGAGPVYVQDREKRYYRRLSEESIFLNKIPDYREFNIIEPLLREDPKYTKFKGFYVPTNDPTLPLYHRDLGRVYFENEQQHRSSIKCVKAAMEIVNEREYKPRYAQPKTIKKKNSHNISNHLYEIKANLLATIKFLNKKDKAVGNDKITESKNSDTTNESKLPWYLHPKDIGQYRTIVDMIIILNKTQHFTSRNLNIAIGVIEHFQWPKIAFECSLQSIEDHADQCFKFGKLNIDKLQKACTRHYENALSNVYAAYVAEKTAALVSDLNEFRRYKNSNEILNDFKTAMECYNIRKANELHTLPERVQALAYFEPINYKLEMLFSGTLPLNWKEISTDGVLDNAKFRYFMIDKYERGFTDKAGKEFKGVKLSTYYFDLNLIQPVLVRDPDYDVTPDYYYIPINDYSLPIYKSSHGKLNFKNGTEKIKFIEEQKVILKRILDYKRWNIK